MAAIGSSAASPQSAARSRGGTPPPSASTTSRSARSARAASGGGSDATWRSTFPNSAFCASTGRVRLASPDSSSARAKPTKTCRVGRAISSTVACGVERPFEVGPPALVLLASLFERFAPRGDASAGSSLSEKSNARNTSHARAAFLPATAASNVRPALCLVRTPLVRCEYTARMRR